MAKIISETENMTIECEDNCDLQVAMDDNGLDVPFSCSSGVCGTCLIDVDSGMENLNEKNEQEDITLQTLGAKENQRLACQCKIKCGEIKIKY